MSLVVKIASHTDFARGRGSFLKVEEHNWLKGALLYMTKIKRFYVVHEPNENFLKYGVSITTEMAFTKSLLLQKGHFLSSLFKKYFSRSFYCMDRAVATGGGCLGGAAALSPQ